MASRWGKQYMEKCVVGNLAAKISYERNIARKRGVLTEC
jgi:hypothetical protein